MITHKQAFAKALDSFHIVRRDVVWQTKVLCMKNQGKFVSEHQLSRWFNTDYHLVVDGLETLETALRIVNPRAAELYYELLASNAKG